MASEDGGNAFPAMFPNAHNTGMTLRDYFAAQAMKAIVGMMHHTENLPPDSLQDFVEGKVYTFPSTQLTCVGDQIETAQTAYAFADAMLAARKEATDGKRD